MAINVKFLKGTQAAYDATTKNADTFYYVNGTDLYLGTIKLSNASDLSNAISRIATNESDIATIQGQLRDLIGEGEGSIAEQIDSAIETAKTELQADIDANTDAIAAINNAQTGILATAEGYTDTAIQTLTNGAVKDAKDAADAAQADVDALETKVGEIPAGATATTVTGYVDEKVGAVENKIGNTALTTDAKTLTGAINELDSAIDNVTTNAAVTIETKGTANTNASKTYVVKQGGTSIGEIDIPKDMVVSSGRVVTLSQAEAEAIDASYSAGKYIELTIANNDGTKLYIAVDDLVDVYTPALGATQVQLSVSGNMISASLVAGGVGETELATNAVTTVKIKDNAVTTDKIADDAVTEDKLADSIVTKLNAGNSALQKADITTGSANGTISVDGDDVAVKGLGSAAYTASTDYATAAQGAKADTAIQGIAQGDNNGEIKYTIDGTNYTAISVKGLGSAAYTASTAYDTAGAATTAENNAKAYVDTALTWGTIA